MFKKKIRRANETDINDILLSRNYNFNRKFMINKNIIPNLEHYIWWFINKRETFVYEINDDHKIYFWHELLVYKSKKILIGGWHANRLKTNLYFVLFILKWQLRYLKRNKKNHDWIAVINKRNKWVLALTKLLGYKSVSSKEIFFQQAIKKIFKVSEKKYFYLKLKI